MIVNIVVKNALLTTELDEQLATTALDEQLAPTALNWKRPTFNAR